jgi:hypothetical protein
MAKMKSINTLLFSFGILIMLSSCTKDQYRGDHLHEKKQHLLTDHHNNFHVKETHRVIKKNENRNEKKEKDAEKERISLKKRILAFGKNNKNGQKKRSIELDFY